MAAQRPPPLIELLESGEKEKWLLETVQSYALLEKTQTARPWSVHHVHEYLEAKRPLDGFTPLHLASKMGFASLCTAIVKGGTPNHLVDQRDVRGQTPLMVAASCSQVDAVKALLEAQADPLMQDDSGKSVLHHAIQKSPNSLNIIDILIGARADIEARDKIGVTPVSLAVCLKNQPCLEAFVKYGCKTINFDREGQTLLDQASVSRRSESTATSCAKGHTAKSATWHRWDNLGESEAQKTVLLEDRITRRQLCTSSRVGQADLRRLHAAKPLLC